jgi:hypothetical protein
MCFYTNNDSCTVSFVTTQVAYMRAYVYRTYTYHPHVIVVGLFVATAIEAVRLFLVDGRLFVCVD